MAESCSSPGRLVTNLCTYRGVIRQPPLSSRTTSSHLRKRGTHHRSSGERHPARGYPRSYPRCSRPGGRYRRTTVSQLDPVLQKRGDLRAAPSQGPQGERGVQGQTSGRVTGGARSTYRSDRYLDAPLQHAHHATLLSDVDADGRRPQDTA